MITQTIDGITFPMREACDFSFLRAYGKVFCVFAKNDSGNISFGLDDGKRKTFVKLAGAHTAESFRSPAEAVAALRAAVPLYEALAHPYLIRLREHFTHESLYAAVFDWAEGDCLFDHWNFDLYASNPHLMPPRKRFHAMPRAKKLAAFDAIFAFLTHVEERGYTAVDFYDGSILYDFARDTTMICDIDFFRKRPTVNDMGADFWGTKRLKAPEEYILGAVIDNVTNVFTLGAMLLHFFGQYTESEIQQMYAANAFFPCRYETWELSEPLYRAAVKAVNPERAERYANLRAFQYAWQSAYHPIVL